MRKNILLISLALLVSLVFLWGCGSSGVVASVNGKDITGQALDEEVAAGKKMLEEQGYNFEGDEGKELEEMMRVSLLEQMITRELLMQEAERLNLLPSDMEVREELDRVKKELGSEGDYKKFLAANGLNEPKLQERLKQDKAMVKLQEKVTAEVPEPTGEEIEAYYENNKEQFSQPEQRQVSHILIGTGDFTDGDNRSEADAKVRALQVVDKLKAGDGFAELAKQYSDDPGSKDNGGQYPPFSRGAGFVKEFEDAAFAMNKGEYTVEPVRTQFGYHVIRLDDVIPASQQSLDEVKGAISSILFEQALKEKGDAFLDKLRDEADIVNKLENKPDK
ncbi:MAG: peptidylprolyl isomerase [Firmicutes bacterium]|nr:peptidylprolyl isomerase [Bacillota bacterium]